jgi:hypothetical protein
MEAASPTAKEVWVLRVAKATAKTGASVETDPSIRPARPGWTIGGLFLAACGFIQLLAQLFGTVLVTALLLGQVIEQLADAGVLGAAGRLFIEAARLHFHGGGFFAHGIEAQRFGEPDRAPMHEAAHVIAADQGNVFAELALVKFDQAAPVAGFFLPHAVEHLRRARKRLA